MTGGGRERERERERERKRGNNRVAIFLIGRCGGRQAGRQAGRQTATWHVDQVLLNLLDSLPKPFLKNYIL